MRFIFTVIALIISFNLLAQVKKLAPETFIQNVTVFASGAQIQRIAQVNLLPGRTEISFNGLSNQLEQQSVQLKSDASITLISVQTIKDHLGQRKIEADERMYLEKRIELQEKIKSDNHLLEVYKNEESMLIKNQAIGGQAGVKTDELKQALDLHRQRLSEVFQKQGELEKRINEQEKQVLRINSQLTEISKKRDSVNYSVVAIVESKETRPVKFELVYKIRDAGWYPTYDVRVTDISKPLAVLMNANVFQRSGETWKDITLQLSTGNPEDNATPTDLQPWRLGYYDPSSVFIKSQVQQGSIAGRVTNERGEPLPNVTVNIKGTYVGVITDANGYFKLNKVPAKGVIVFSLVGYQLMEAPVRPGYYSVSLKPSTANLEEVVVAGYSKSSEAYNNYDYKKERKQDEMQTVSSVIQQQPTAILYKIDEKYTLETDGKTTTIGIKKIEMNAGYEFYAAPKIDPSVFLTAKIADWQQYDLQSGEASLYFEGTFLGKTYIDLSEASDTLSLSLGKDQSVKVSRKLSKEYSSKKLIGSNKTEEREYEIVLRNTKKSPVHIIVMDHVPVSINREIDVSGIRAPEAELDEETGMVTWNLSLQPGQEKKLTVRFSVKYPKDKKVVLD